MSLEEFEDHIKNFNYGLRFFGLVNKYKSVRRAIKRGHLTRDGGFLIPKRPFNNRANTSTRSGVHSRVFNEFKKIIYDQLTKH